MLDLQIIAGGRAMPIFDLPVALGRSQAAREIGDTIDVLIALMDDLAGDCDLEDDDPAGGNIEDEPHDPEEDCCKAGDDMMLAGPVIERGRWLDHCRQFHGERVGSDEDAETDHRRIGFDYGGNVIAFPGYNEAVDNGFTA